MTGVALYAYGRKPVFERTVTAIESRYCKVEPTQLPGKRFRPEHRQYNPLESCHKALSTSHE